MSRLSVSYLVGMALIIGSAAHASPPRAIASEISTKYFNTYITVFKDKDGVATEDHLGLMLEANYSRGEASTNAIVNGEFEVKEQGKFYIDLSSHMGAQQGTEMTSRYICDGTDGGANGTWTKILNLPKLTLADMRTTIENRLESTCIYLGGKKVQQPDGNNSRDIQADEFRMIMGGNGLAFYVPTPRKCHYLKASMTCDMSGAKKVVLQTIEETKKRESYRKNPQAKLSLELDELERKLSRGY